MNSEDKLMLKKLEKSLKPKVMQAVKLTLEIFWCYDIRMVNAKDVEGMRMRSVDWFWQSSAVRCVYFNRTNGNDDGEIGVLYIPAGGGRFVHLRISC